MRVIIVLLMALSCLIGSPLARAENPAKMDMTALCIGALSENPGEARQAIAALRSAGPAGLEALMGTYEAAIVRHRENPTRPEAMWDRLSAALDEVAAQKDAWAAGLYWYTDLEQAKAAAKASGRPILSLRLLGRLDTELSCANSRFFRTALYPDGKVGRYLRENFILHWKSHRPVPKLTIDFGDGRTIERTITGNSVHYVLTSDGRVVDVIPGLYGPQAFYGQVARAHEVAVSLKAGRTEALVAFHASQLQAERVRWNRDLSAIGVKVGLVPLTKGGKLTTAMAGARITAAKSAAEVPAIVALTPDRAALVSNTDDAAWAKIAAMHADEAVLDAGSRAVIASKAGDAVKANNLTAAKRRVEDPVTRLVRTFERSIAEDTVRNEYLFHTQIHEWFINGQIPASLDDLNERVYAELFLMPKKDPYLGLVPADTYTGLPADSAAVKNGDALLRSSR